ncbi:HU family DNA-binding protein [Bosea sp. TWI1241]|uniref:HU family DNA-binding protein n=1 Tax=Bosea sp. TWI1241 TaxID=3148904 RepID=UPI0032091F31
MVSCVAHDDDSRSVHAPLRPAHAHSRPPQVQEDSMTKNELIAAIADETGKSKADVSAVLASMAGVVTKALKDGGDVTLGGIGKLAAAKREAREARNPATGAMIKVPAKTVVKFKVTKDLAEAVA